MSMMKRLVEEESGIIDVDWRVLPVVERVSDRRHVIRGSEYRLMEHIGKGRWVERKRGSMKELTTLSNHYIKEGYHTPPTPEEQTEVSRFSVMERARVSFQ